MIMGCRILHILIIITLCGCVAPRHNIVIITAREVSDYTVLVDGKAPEQGCTSLEMKVPTGSSEIVVASKDQTKICHINLLADSGIGDPIDLDILFNVGSEYVGRTATQYCEIYGKGGIFATFNGCRPTNYRCQDKEPDQGKEPLSSPNDNQ